MLALVCVEGLPYVDAADVLGIPVGRLKSELVELRVRIAPAVQKVMEAPLLQ